MNPSLPCILPDAAECGAAGHGAPFRAPLDAGAIDSLLAAHAHERQRIAQLAALVDGDLDGVFVHFIEGNAGDERLHRQLYLNKLFQTRRAFLALDAAYWRRLLALSGIARMLPQERRAQWERQLASWKCDEGANLMLPFEAKTVYATLADLLERREQFMHERIGGLYRALSHRHASNAGAGFCRRLILAGVFNQQGAVDDTQAGIVHDLRAVCGLFMGLDEPNHNETEPLLAQARDCPGCWLAIDGHALRLRAWRSGTLHVEIHPAMVVRLNAVLGTGHARALARPARGRARTVTPPPALRRPLSFSARYLLATASVGQAGTDIGLSAVFDKDAAALDEAGAALLQAGARAAEGSYRYRFEADARAVLAELVRCGCLPDAPA